MQILTYYFLGVAVSGLLGIVLCVIFRSGLKSFFSGIFKEDTAKKFWARITYTIILLSSISGAMANTYPEEAANDPLIMLWGFMDQMEGMGFRLLWTLLVIFSVLILAHVLHPKKK
jgi:hypothetical protein